MRALGTFAAFASLAIMSFVGGVYFERDFRRVWFPRSSDHMSIVIDGTGLNGGGPSLQLNMDGRPMGWIALNAGTRSYIQEELGRLP